MTTKDREILENIFKELSELNDGSKFSRTRLIKMANHIIKCEQQSRTGKENELLTKTTNWLSRRIEEWEKVNNTTLGAKVRVKENALVLKDPRSKLSGKDKALEPWNKLSDEDKAFLKSCAIKP